MPPRTRSKLVKGSKENIGVVDKIKLKTITKTTKPQRKALADKTNSASDDNASIENPKVFARKSAETPKVSNLKLGVDNKQRPRRERRLPNRYIGNNLLNNLSNSKENGSLPVKQNPEIVKAQTLIQDDTSVAETLFKTPQKGVNSSLITSRPRRIYRLPSKYEDHSISPIKFIPIQPCQASTPIVETNVKIIKKPDVKTNLNAKKPVSQKVSKQTSKTDQGKKGALTKSIDTSVKKINADSNNNAEQGRALRSKTTNKCKSVSKDKIDTIQKMSNKNSSFRILDEMQSQEEVENRDIYEFTYDPNEEPSPQKKKRKKVVKKNQAKPKMFFFKNNYDKNLSKALASLKKVISKNSPQKQNSEKNIIKIPVIRNATNNNMESKTENTTNTQAIEKIQNPVVQQGNVQHVTSNITEDNMAKPPNTATENKSVSNQVENIAADLELTKDHNDEINYSPVASPARPDTPNLQEFSTTRTQTSESYRHNNDPLNLQEDLSFFNDQPVANSSMNVSARHPLASPWRAEFERLPIKWQVNTYVKPNMTPAVESSFINFDENKKKHVYTNLVPQINDALEKIVQNDTSKLKQTSIISFIKEVVEKHANKKKRGRSATPTNYIFDDIPNISAKSNANDANKNHRKLSTPKKGATDNSTTPNKNTSTDVSSNSEKQTSISNKVNSKEAHKCKNTSDPNVTPVKTLHKEKDNNETYFGFDDSENQEQENVCPNKNVDKQAFRSLRPRTRAVLKEINEQMRPTRAALSITAKNKSIPSTEAVKLYEDMKSASDAPFFPEKDVAENGGEVTNIDKPQHEDLNNEDSQSVHLFEDIELVHHLKPNRKSYSKVKKVAFRQNSLSDSDTQDSNAAAPEDSMDEDNFSDLTFKIPTIEPKRKVTKKKETKKQKLTKKEAAEAEAWAAGFNSMCEDVEEFPLIVE